MRLTEPVRHILEGYGGERPGVKANLARMLMAGRPGGSGKLVILPVDQGFEHGPGRSFAPNPPAYDPDYVFDLAISAGLSALAAPVGLLSACADRHAGEVPLILKANSANSLARDRDQAITATPRDAVELGCSAVGYTVYPGSEHQYEMFEEVREAIAEARSFGLATVVWAYPRGDLTMAGETALDVIAYAAHMAALLGAHIIKVKPPSAHIELEESKSVYADMGRDFSKLSNRIAHVIEAAFNGRRIVVFSGGPARDLNGLYEEINAIHEGGGFGSIVGRNSFQRPREEALDMLSRIIDIHTGARSSGI